jgi:hypothetical protein
VCVNWLPSLLTLRPYTPPCNHLRNQKPCTTQNRERGVASFFSEEGTGLEVHEGDRSLLEFYIKCPLVRRMGITREYTSKILYYEHIKYKKGRTVSKGHHQRLG